MSRAPSALAGVIGWPLDHTLSPLIHNAAFRGLGLEWAYFAWPVPPEALNAAVEGVRALGIRGINVTMPHKEAVVPLLDDVTADAAAVGAVNTVHAAGGRLVGHNTDVEGFREFLAGDAGFEPRGKSALVLGAGGAARAVVRALDDLGVGSIAVAARDPGKAAGLQSVSELVTPARWDEAEGLARAADLVVNTTPLGTGGAGEAVGGEVFRRGQTVVDLVYDPPATPLVESARQAGAEAWGGIGMLVRQAAASFRIWTGQAPPVELMSAAALRAVGAEHLRH